MITAVTAILIAALTLLPTDAWAACAWVLWEHQSVAETGGSPVDTWAIDAAWPDAPGCTAAQEVRLQQAMARTPPHPTAEVSRTGNTVTASSSVRVWWTFRYLCLPDTVDPRGPRGGGR